MPPARWFPSAALLALCWLGVAGSAAFTFHLAVKPTAPWAVEAAGAAAFWSSTIALPALIDVKGVDFVGTSADCVRSWHWASGRELWLEVKRACLQVDLAIDVADAHVGAAQAGATRGTAEINGSYPQLTLASASHYADGDTRRRTGTTAVPLRVAFVCDTQDGSVWNVQNLDEGASQAFIVHGGLEARLSHPLAPLASVQIVTSHRPPYRVDQPVVSWLGRRWGEPFHELAVLERAAAQSLSPVLFHSGYRTCFCGLNVACRPESGHATRQAARTVAVIQSTQPTAATMVAFNLFASPSSSPVFGALAIAISGCLFLGAMVVFFTRGANLLPNSRAARAFERSLLDSSLHREEPTYGNAAGEERDFDETRQARVRPAGAPPPAAVPSDRRHPAASSDAPPLRRPKKAAGDRARHVVVFDSRTMARAQKGVADLL